MTPAADRRRARELVRLEEIAERTRPRASYQERAQDRLRNPITVRLSIVPSELNGENSRAELLNVREES